MLKFLKSIFNFREQKRQLLEIVLVTFLVTFCVARAWSLFIGNSIYIRGYQIHHFYFGTLILTIGGLISLLGRGTKTLRTASLFMGVGMGLFADEIGLLLNCTTSHRSCAYAFPDSGDFIGAIALVMLLLLVLVELFEQYDASKKTLARGVGTKEDNDLEE